MNYLLNLLNPKNALQLICLVGRLLMLALVLAVISHKAFHNDNKSVCHYLEF